MLKRILSLTLALCMIAALLPAAAFASEESNLEDLQFTIVNPLYADTISKNDLVKPDSSALLAPGSGNAYYDAETAGKIIRPDLVARKPEISVNLTFPYHNDTIQQDAQNQIYAVLASAMAHTGNPLEGDYLLWQFSGVNVSTANPTIDTATGNVRITIIYTMTYQSSAEQEAELDIAVAKLLEELDVSGKDSYTKLKAIYDYITANVTYDNAHLNDNSYDLKNTAYAALINRTAVCRGYAALLYRLALELGVDCRIIPGTSKGQSHVWNIARIGDLYYNLDATWDSQIPVYQCFLMGSDLADHNRWDKPGQLPTGENYNSAEFHQSYPMSGSRYTNTHTHAYTSVVTAPTCTEPGYTTYTCTCGHSYVDDTVAALGHNEVTDTGYAATCTKNGLTDGVHCERCDTVLTEQGVIPKKGHSWDNGSITREPTEEETGILTYTCTVCQETRTETIPALDHKHKYATVVTAPTCTEAGFTTYSCACGDSYTDDVTAALGHLEVTDKGFAATCTNNGLTDGSHCGRCNLILTKQEKLPALGHEKVTDQGYDATCTEDGLTDGIHCERCNAVFTAQEVIPALGHQEITDKGFAATCTNSGLTDGAHCGRCNAVVTTQEEIPAKGHSWDAGAVTKEPTEEEPGTRTYSCTVCRQTRTETIPALDHEHVYTAVVTAPTCTESGYTTYTCACGDTYQVAGSPAKGHTEILNYGKDATCTEAGLTDGSHCNVCHAVLIPQEEIPALGHEEVADAGYAATCTGDGLTDGVHCNRCNAVLTAQEEIPALGHEEVTEDAIAASCTEDGLTEGKYCSRCGEILTRQEVIPARGHSWDNGKVTREPTEKETGVRTYVCSVCTETRTEEIPCIAPVREIIRISGSSRVSTAIAVADKLKAAWDRETFDAVIITNGNSFADALTGSYLATVKEAPILLYRSSEFALNEEYIHENLSKNGTVYILGGTAAVPADVEERMAAAGYRVERLFGDTRYSTNLRILEAAGVESEEILICTGADYADSLAASATGLPIVMVNTVTGKLTEDQIAFFLAHADHDFTIVGGSAAISDALKAEIEDLVGNVDRIFGNSREETAVAIAERYFSDPDRVLVTFSRNFPDGLCGGPLAYAMKVPLLLVSTHKEYPAAEYVADHAIVKGIILGGTAAVSEDSVQNIFPG